ncbi:MAG: arginase family protein [Chloroflexi bacterium]|nr:arginase family protein [Chloroflexota bacterium]
MTTKTIEFLGPPQIIRLNQLEGQKERRVSNWITAWDFSEAIDVGIVGVPLSKAGHLPAGVDSTPNAIRKAFIYFTTYDPDLGVDIQSLKVRYVGDVRLHATDLVENNRRIEQAMKEVFGLTGRVVTVIMGGDGSITAPVVRGMAAATKQKIGLVWFDSRADSRDVAEGGQSDVTPLRNILEAGVVQGSSTAVVGLHGFASSMEEHGWAAGQGVTLITARQARKEGIANVTQRALEVASKGTDAVYVSVDGTVLDMSSSASHLATVPGGLSWLEVQEALFLLGQGTRVKALDITAIDTYDDIKEVVARTSAGLLLAFLAGVKLRK